MSLLFVSVASCMKNSPRYDPTKLSATKVKKAPVIDGKVDRIWGKSPELLIGLAGSSDKVYIKALYADTDLYILAKWPDKTASFTRGKSWSYKEGAWVNTSSKKIYMGDQSEDRISFMWPIGNASTLIGDYGSFFKRGCMSKCHTVDLHPVEIGGEEGTEDECYLNSGKGDLWHMKAARCLGVELASGSDLVIDSASHQVTDGQVTLKGWCDDTYVSQYSFDNAPDGGRFGDDGEPAYSTNANADKTAPKFIETAPSDFMDAMFLTEAEIAEGEAVEVERLIDAELLKYWDNYADLDAIVPERVLGFPAGSRADIEQGASWADGYWTSESKRALVTGNDDDVQFDDLSKEYLFGVATMDNSGGENHRASQKQTLVFVR